MTLQRTSSSTSRRSHLDMDTISKDRMEENRMGHAVFETLQYMQAEERSQSEAPEGMENLRELNLTGCLLVVGKKGGKLPREIPRAILKMNNLTRVVLKRNRITNIPSFLADLKNLSDLDLSENNFIDFPEVVCNMPGLMILDLQHNKISKISPNVVKMKGLQKLMLGENQIDTFSDKIWEIPDLKEVDLSKNKIGNIKLDANTLSQAKNSKIRKILLRNNGMNEFPIGLCASPHLEELDLIHNEISMIKVDNDVNGASIRSKLKKLWLSYNSLTDISPTIRFFCDLQLLDLTSNKLESISPDIGHLSNLEFLWIDNNHITHLPYQITELTKLSSFDFEKNPLVVPPIDLSKKGKETVFRYLRALEESKAVTTCRLQINFLGETCSGKTSLARSLRTGKSMLTPEADRTHVVEQSLWEPLIYSPEVAFNINDFGGHEVYKIGHPVFIAKSGVVLLTFDLSSCHPEEHEYQYKYDICIGSWIDRIQSQVPDMKMVIVGTHYNEEGDESVRHSQHNLCCKIKESVKKQREKRIQWLRAHIEKLSQMMQKPNAFQQSAYQEKAEKLQKLINQPSSVHDEIFCVSSKTMEGFDSLQAFLVLLAQEKAVTLPKSWASATSKIYMMKYQPESGNTLQWKTVRDMIIKCAPKTWKILEWFGIKTKEDVRNVVKDILSFLFSRGEIIWYDTNPSLRSTVFHKQETLANLLKAVFNHDVDKFMGHLEQTMKFSQTRLQEIKTDLSVRGAISKQVMDCLWQPFGLSTVEADAMIELMKKLELCYRIQEQTVDGSTASYHFPWLLNQDKPDTVDAKWPQKFDPETETELALRAFFPHKIPDGLFEKISVRQHNYLEMNKFNRVDWKDGVYAELQFCKLRIIRRQTHSDEWMISVAVRGKNLVELWGPFLQTKYDLEDIIQQDWPGVPYDMYMVCPHCLKNGEEAENCTLFAGELLTRPPPSDSHVPCENTGEMIPTTLLYPQLSGYEAMSKAHKKAIIDHHEELISTITHPCLLDMLDEFLQENIITYREAETVKTEPSLEETDTKEIIKPQQTDVFLEIIKTREDRSFYYLLNGLGRNGQEFLAKCIRAYPCKT